MGTVPEVDALPLLPLLLILLAGLTLALAVTTLVVALLLPRQSKRWAAAAAARRPSIRLLSRLLFARHQPGAITLDCLLVSVEGPASGVAPAGLPFTLQLHAPEAAIARQVDELLDEWTADSRELMLELSEDRGRVRTTIASGKSSVQLELSGAAGLQLNS